jgi:hypothetical protein
MRRHHLVFAVDGSGNRTISSGSPIGRPTVWSNTTSMATTFSTSVAKDHEAAAGDGRHAIVARREFARFSEVITRLVKV